MESCCYICVVNFLDSPITGLLHRSSGMFLSPDRVSISLRLYSLVQLLGFMSPNFAFNLYSSISSPNISISHLGIVPENKHVKQQYTTLWQLSSSILGQMKLMSLSSPIFWIHVLKPTPILASSRQALVLLCLCGIMLKCRAPS